MERNHLINTSEWFVYMDLLLERQKYLTSRGYNCISYPANAEGMYELQILNRDDATTYHHDGIPANPTHGYSKGTW
jgi:hypothetical protein